MKNKKWLILLAVVLIVFVWLWYSGRLGSPAGEGHQAASYAEGSSAGALDDQLLVDFKDDASLEEVRAVERRYRLQLKPNSRFSLAQRLYRTVLRAREITDLLRRLRSEPTVEHAELDLIYGIPPLEESSTRFTRQDEAAPQKFPNDPKYRFQWHLDQIGMPAAWSKATGKGVIVAVIDTGVAYRDIGNFRRVPDLARTEFAPGYDFVNKHDRPLDDHGHGTHVAGTIAQSTNNGLGVAGVAYRARIMPLKVLSSRGFGSVADIAEAVRFAADHGAKVINMSLGGRRSSKILASAVAYAHKRGVVVVCAAGNDGQGQVSYPAAYPGAIAVAATQYDRKTTFYSNWGKEIDLAAPGGNTRLDQNGDGLPDGVMQNTLLPGRLDQSDYLLYMGTSMASPHVAGVAALVIESGVSTPDAVERLLTSTSRHPEGKRRDDHYGAGIVDAAAALARTKTTWGGMKLGLSGLLGLVLLLRLRERGLLGLRPGPGLILGLLLGSAGFFFLPRLGDGLLGTTSELLASGFPSWDTVLLGPASHGNPLFFSLLAPALLAVSLYSLPRLRGLLVGFSVGVGAHLLFHAVVPAIDVAAIPNVLFLDQAFLTINGLLCLAIGQLLARR